MPTFRTSTPGSAAEPGKPHLILVGLPGSGKSTVGAGVADRLRRSFLDFDAEIEAREGATITALFAQHGESYFRGLERRLTEELAQVGDMVLAPGGGWIVNPEVVALLRPPGRIIYLAVRPEVALERMGRSLAVRPLLRGPDPLAALRALLARREALYRAADHRIDTDLLTTQQVISRVAELASGMGGE